MSIRALGVATLAVSFTLSACGSLPSHHSARTSQSDQPVVSGHPAGYNADDDTFAGNMLFYDQQADNLSALVPSRSSDPDVIALAGRSTTAAQDEMAALRALRVQWSENPDSKTGDGGHSASLNGTVNEMALTKLKTLQGSEFDTQWLQLMTGLDRGAVEVANAEIANGKNIDAINEAKRIVPARQADIVQMQHMLNS